ncbi:MAG: outer membrane protein assembly factor BamB [Hydrogenophaga sp.]|uniref:Outer membrane protein assembly factor BamB n=1 Tax=Hydrogenophaga crocea TaxID=2716225 RepID=A0A6G8IGF6_9BURK|nr:MULTISPECIES: outer membrane protein assembly factor BamB [Hydrogenophaga]MBL0946032.1 outer membrane protein assembly factor BamB [Hydrogenophaga sp.]QIM52199.1 outer membrane protein assembly factor BamB [Hydrogenophaga crocea]
MIRRHLLALGMASVALLAACSSGPKKPDPTPLAPPAALMGTRQIWTAQVGEGGVGFVPVAAGGRVFAAGSAGVVAAIDAATGADVWRVDLRTRLSAGVGSDGQTAAVITGENLLVALADGKERWRVRLAARSFTPPLVAGGRVFVFTADRSVAAYDAANGARLWGQTRTADPLVLSRPAALAAVGDTLVAGVSGRLVGLNPDNGAVRWEVPVANARGTNEVERLIDIVAPVGRLGNEVCVRAYGAAVGCVDTLRGQPVWTRAAQGTSGVHGDDRLLFGSESDGTLIAWRRGDGEPAWRNEHLKYHRLAAPLALGRVFALGDGNGLVHLLSREDGSEMTRLSTDGSAIVSQPALAGDALVVLTSRGGLYAWRPQ